MKTNIKNNLSALAVLAALSFTGVAYASDTVDTSTFPHSHAVAAASVNINTADAQQIAGKVTGIGQKRAEAIVAYRTEHGPFKSFDDLAQVKGIGESYVKTHLDVLKQAFIL